MYCFDECKQICHAFFERRCAHWRQTIIDAYTDDLVSEVCSPNIDCDDDTNMGVVESADRSPALIDSLSSSLCCFYKEVLEGSMVQIINLHTTDSSKANTIEKVVFIPRIEREFRVLDEEVNLCYAIFDCQKGSHSPVLRGFFPVRGPVRNLYEHAPNTEEEEEEISNFTCCLGDVEVAYITAPLSKQEVEKLSHEKVTAIPESDLMGYKEIDLYVIERGISFCRGYGGLSHDRADDKKLEKLRDEVHSIPFAYKCFLERRLPTDLSANRMSYFEKLLVTGSSKQDFDVAKKKSEGEGEESGSRSFLDEEENVEIGDVHRTDAFLREYSACCAFIPLSIPHLSLNESDCRHLVQSREENELLVKMEDREKLELNFRDIHLETQSGYVMSEEVVFRLQVLFKLCDFVEETKRGFRSLGESCIPGAEVMHFGSVDPLSHDVDLIKTFLDCRDAPPLEEKWGPDGEYTENYKKRTEIKRRSLCLGSYLASKGTQDDVTHRRKSRKSKGESVTELSTDAIGDDWLLDHISYLAFIYFHPKTSTACSLIYHLLRYRLQQQKNEFLKYFCHNRRACRWANTGMLARFRVHSMHLNGIFDDYINSYFDSLSRHSFKKLEEKTMESSAVKDANVFRVYISLYSAPVKSFWNSISALNPDFPPRNEVVPVPLGEVWLGLETLGVDDFLLLVASHYTNVTLCGLAKGLCNTEAMCYKQNSRHGKGGKGECEEEDVEETEYGNIIVGLRMRYRIVHIHAFFRKIAERLSLKLRY